MMLNDLHHSIYVLGCFGLFSFRSCVQLGFSLVSCLSNILGYFGLRLSMKESDCRIIVKTVDKKPTTIVQISDKKGNLFSKKAAPAPLSFFKLQNNLLKDFRLFA
jgi:hypothetical protein